MKKLLGIVVLGLLLSGNTTFANDPNSCGGTISQKAIKAQMNKDYSAAFNFAKEASIKEKTACADFILGASYFEGLGVQKNQTKGISYYKQGAEKGMDLSQKFLATAYYQGVGVERNPQEAAKWFKILAEKNNANGQTYLAYMYSSGDGINQDLIQSYKWFYIVSKQHSEPANSEIKKLQDYMSAADVDEAIKKADNWLRKR